SPLRSGIHGRLLLVPALLDGKSRSAPRLLGFRNLLCVRHADPRPYRCDVPARRNCNIHHSEPRLASLAGTSIVLGSGNLPRRSGALACSRGTARSGFPLAVFHQRKPLSGLGRTRAARLWSRAFVALVDRTSRLVLSVERLCVFRFSDLAAAPILGTGTEPRRSSAPTSARVGWFRPAL